MGWGQGWKRVRNHKEAEPLREKARCSRLRRLKSRSGSKPSPYKMFSDLNLQESKDCLAYLDLIMHSKNIHFIY